ncbi:TPA: hypothetical protein DEP96_04070 [Candidatus Uhrbacteria bacterium]|nr:hypothetical protein [Candidatus Uhrbacteria bacterium]
MSSLPPAHIVEQEVLDSDDGGGRIAASGLTLLTEDGDDRVVSSAAIALVQRNCVTHGIANEATPLFGDNPFRGESATWPPLNCITAGVVDADDDGVEVGVGH